MTEQYHAFIVADGQQVSWCTAYICQEEKTCLISALDTKDCYQGRGYATSLLKDLIALLKERKIAYLYLDDMSHGIPPRNIYYKLGFQILGRGESWRTWRENSEIVGPERRMVV